MEVQDVALEPGVLASLFAEGEDGGADAALLGDGGDGGEDLDLDLDPGLEEGAGAGAGDAEGEAEKVDLRRGSKEFRDWLKNQEATPEGAKFAKTARADHFRVQELATLEPGGVTAMREKYALIESVGGLEGLTGLQERVSSADAVDEALMAGDPKALEGLGPDFDPGLAKLAPTILDRVMRSDPAAYAATILPHLMTALSSSPLVGDLNKMIDVLQAGHLDEKGKIAGITKLLSSIGAWYDAQEKKSGELKTGPVDKERNDIQEQRTQLEKDQQTQHWNTKIGPPVAQYERTKLEELFKPFDARLKLDAAAKADLFGTFKAKLSEAAKADAQYMKQMALYRKQKNPDPAVVQNFVKNALNRHAKNVVEAATKARYGRFLGGAKGSKGAPVAGARAAGETAGAGVVIVSVRPSPEDIDYRRTSEKDQWDKVYTLKTGKKVKWVKPA